MTRAIFWLLMLFILPTPPVQAAPSSEYWKLWDKSNEQSLKSVDHSAWGQFLERYLKVSPDVEGRVLAYGKVSAEDRTRLKEYIQSLTKVDPRQYSRAVQMAYWINLYNALTVELILENYPVKSITKIGPWYAFGPWDQELTKVAGQSLSLNDIEHRILRPLWQDKRIHYAVNCASKGCPDLASEPYTAVNLEKMLAEASRRFINQKKGVEFVGGKLVLSRIYEWYGEDFGARKDLLVHLKANANEKLKKRLEKYTGLIDYRYDWSLNDSKGR
ncbi:DUF547 domain-containing protein [Endozoicomonas numazuensis]|uniref:DUF547 domain-containing protein n=1 Tax=Endozoicomonas numazuensis TaxID=1137799 RepID=A0A081NFN8_9GAMM|nr:DUF547 domain-containing protein [Endozoicomonas numazuensis]KEQ17261.1 hypothetical protein GZ78_15660 [Endozoicomonas numazuensis]